jgi:hypothetical protein
MQTPEFVPGMFANLWQRGWRVNPPAAAIDGNLQIRVASVRRNPLASRKIQRVNQGATLCDAELQIENGVSDKAVIGKIASYLENPRRRFSAFRTASFYSQGPRALQRRRL